MKPWEILKTKTVFKNRWRHLDEELVQLPDGSTANWYVDKYNTVVGIFAVTENGKIIINKQYKHGARNLICEPPFGIVQKGEIPQQAIERELIEETGYKVNSIKNIAQYYGQPTGSTLKIHLYFGTGASKIRNPANDPKENIEVLIITPNELMRMVKTGKINSEGGLAAIFLGMQHLNPKFAV